MRVVFKRFAVVSVLVSGNVFASGADFSAGIEIAEQNVKLGNIDDAIKIYEAVRRNSEVDVMSADRAEQGLSYLAKKFGITFQPVYTLKGTMQYTPPETILNAAIIQENPMNILGVATLPASGAGRTISCYEKLLAHPDATEEQKTIARSKLDKLRQLTCEEQANTKGGVHVVNSSNKKQ